LLLGPIAFSGPADSLKSLKGTPALDAKGITLEVPDGWSLAHRSNVYVVSNTPGGADTDVDPDKLRRVARILVLTESFSDHAAAVQWLRVIGVEKGTDPTFLQIGGWPALQRRVSKPLGSPLCSPSRS